MLYSVGMEMPLKLRILLVVWMTLGGLIDLISLFAMITTPELILSSIFLILGTAILVSCYLLWQGNKKARPILISISVISLVLVPVGTILGLITIAVLFLKDVKNYYLNNVHRNARLEWVAYILVGLFGVIFLFQLIKVTTYFKTQCPNLPRGGHCL